MMQYMNPLEPRGQATMVSLGLMTFVCVGVAACLALVVVVFFLVVQFILIILQATVEAFESIATIWVTADPFTKVIILAALGYGVYRVYQWRTKRERK
jgi:hypothetical protein